jgi:hypothetical protein
MVGFGIYSYSAGVHEVIGPFLMRPAPTHSFVVGQRVRHT